MTLKIMKSDETRVIQWIFRIHRKKKKQRCLQQTILACSLLHPANSASLTLIPVQNSHLGAQYCARQERTRTTKKAKCTPEQLNPPVLPFLRQFVVSQSFTFTQMSCHVNLYYYFFFPVNSILLSILCRTEQAKFRE